MKACLVFVKMKIRARDDKAKILESNSEDIFCGRSAKM